MALGDQGDLSKRLTKLLPYSWFPNPTVVLNGVLQGYATVAAAMYTMLKYAKAQTRMRTTSDAFLDIAGYDFIGARLPRYSGESDASYRNRIIAEVLRFRNTRLAIEKVLMELTGRTPQIFEPWNTNDAGAIGINFALAGGPFAGNGFLGSTSMPYMVFINAFRPFASWGLAVTDADIYSAVNNVRAAGITAWVNIQN